MLNKANRLLKKNDFNNTWKNGRSVFGRFLGAKAIKNELEVNRFGIMVGLKFSKKAVERNKIKRRLRYIIRLLSSALFQGVDVAISVLPSAKNADFTDLKKELEYIFKRLRILKDAKNF